MRLSHVWRVGLAFLAVLLAALLATDFYVLNILRQQAGARNSVTDDLGRPTALHFHSVRVRRHLLDRYELLACHDTSCESRVAATNLDE